MYNKPLNRTLNINEDAAIVRPTDAQDEIRTNRRAGVRGFTKFGYRETLQAATGEQTIWATTGNFTPMTTASTFTITYTNTSDGSTANGAKTLYFDYVDSDGLPAQATHTLGSSGSDVTSFSGLGLNRVAVSSSGSTQTNGAAITITDTTGATTQGIIPTGQGVTQQAIFHVGSNHDGVAKYLWINCNKLSGSNPKVVFKGLVFNRAVETIFEVFRCTVDTSVVNFVEISEPIGFNLSPSDVLYFVADTDQNNTIAAIRFSLNEYSRS